MMASWLLLFALPELCWAHGKLTRPTPRDGITVGRAGLDENNPVSFEPGCSGPMNRCDAFVCREDTPGAVTEVTAGGSLAVQWSFTAFHVGDCAVYISYDVNLPRSQQKYVKIANLPDCKSYSTKSIRIPSGLPAGRAILRWDWAALHIWPTVEFYVQCADIQISSSSDVRPADLDSYSITNPPVYPDDGNDGVGYRNAFRSSMDQTMTGPSCFDDSINECSLTAAGTLRNTDSRRGISTPSPLPSPLPSPPPSTTSSTLSPSPSTTAPTPTTTRVADCVPIGDCSAYSWCNQPAYVEYCATEAGACPAPWCQTQETTASSTTTTSSIVSTTAAPSPSPSGSCIASLTSFYTDASIWEPFCATAWTAGSCPAPMCRQTSLLAVKSRRQSFLGTALLQSGVSLEQGNASAEL